MKRAALVCLLALAAPLRAEPILLRMATVAPQGTAWAREGVAFERDFSVATHGQARIKWYLGGIAGDENEMLARIKRDQLDGVASGGMLCMKLAPSLRALRIVGLFQSREESAYVSGRLKDTVDLELAHNGFVNLGDLGVGPDVIFTRRPVTSLAELRATRLWIWDLDEVYGLELPAMGIPTVAVPVQRAFEAYDHGNVDGFFAVPTAALAFQWSAETHYLADLRASFLRGCFLISSRAFDQLTIDQQRALKGSAARSIARLEELGRAQDASLLGELFEKQGIKPIPVSAQFRAEFFEAARLMRERLGEQLVPRALLQRVIELLADYRAEHRALRDR